jgi:peptidoglycan hydrolase-like protein with peptidoglycan-binding domain
MRPPESFVAQPVRSLQTMLRVIAESNGEPLSVIPDGIYGQNTVNAVSAFQRRKGLSPTGVADQQTWDAIAGEYATAIIVAGEPQPVNVLFETNQVIRAGEENPNLYLVQAILTVLSQAYASITAPGFSGILDIPTAESISSFQVLNGLPATGELDRITWHNLALHYPLATRLLIVPLNEIPYYPDPNRFLPSQII